MSETPPMTQVRRLASYCGERSGPMTPAQTRRYRHKARHDFARRNPSMPRKAQRHDLEGLVATWDESWQKPKVPAPAQLDRFIAEQVRVKTDAPRGLRVRWAKRAGRRGE